MIEDIDRDVFVRIQTDLLVVGDSIVTDRHHASNGNYEDDDPQNQIEGIFVFTLAGNRETATAYRRTFLKGMRRRVCARQCLLTSNRASPY